MSIHQYHTSMRGKKVKRLNGTLPEGTKSPKYIPRTLPNQGKGKAVPRPNGTLPGKA